MSRVLSRVLVAAALIMLVAGGLKAADQKQPIKIGAFFALSGPAAPIGTPTKLVAEMAVDQINKAGGINGQPPGADHRRHRERPGQGRHHRQEIYPLRQGGGHHRAHLHRRGHAGEEDRGRGGHSHLHDRGR